MLLEASGIAASVNPSALTPHKKAHGITENQHAKKRMRTLARSRTPHSQSASTHSSAATRYSATPAAIVITSVSTPVRLPPILPKAT
jgi:hypothetical protein